MDLEKLLARWKEFRYTKNISLPKVNLPKMNVSGQGLSKILLGLGAIGVLGGVGYGGCKAIGCAGSTIANVMGIGGLDDYLPEGFKDLELGMSYQEVQEIRPFIKNTGEEGQAYETIKDYSSSSSEETLANISRFFEYEGKEIGAFKVEYSFDNNRLAEIKLMAGSWRGDELDKYSDSAYEKLTDVLGEAHSKKAGRWGWDIGGGRFIRLEHSSEARFENVKYIISRKKEE